MESQPQNPEYKNNPENFHPCISKRHFHIANQMISLCVGAFVFPTNS